MDEREMYTRYLNMQGDSDDRIAYLANLYGVKVKEIKEALQRQAANPSPMKAVTPEQHMAECHPMMNVYHPDENPFCKIRVMAPETNKIATNAIYTRLDELDKEIKTLDEKKKLLEIEYQALVGHLEGKA